jgi:prepilin-type N-terminal cleavage/methylation domain-containing protein
VKNKGFTLIEVLMVVLIVGILASLAMPQYTKVVEKAKMSEAKTVLSAIRTSEGVYFMENDSYTETLASLDLDAGVYADGLFSYSLKLDGTDLTKFTIEAKRLGSGNYKDGTLTMAQNGSLTEDGTIYKNMISTGSKK